MNPARRFALRDRDASLREDGHSTQAAFDQARRLDGSVTSKH
jgi:hypothetical protein